MIQGAQAMMLGSTLAVLIPFLAFLKTLLNSAPPPLEAAGGAPADVAGGSAEG